MMATIGSQKFWLKFKVSLLSSVDPVDPEDATDVD